MDTVLLEKIGLTRNESAVYLALARKGTAKVGSILSSAGLNSGKIYEILDALKRKGIVSESVIDGVKHYTAGPPARLLDYVETKKKALAEDEQALQQAIPELERLRKQEIKAVRSFTYTGIEGIKTAAHEALDALQEGDEILGMGITSLKDKAFNDFWLRFGNERVKRRIKARHIYSERSAFLNAYKNIKLTEHKVLEGVTPVTVDVFGDEIVLILNYNAPASCILIYDTNTAKSFRNFFEGLWEMGKR